MASILANIFTWFKSKEDQSEPTKKLTVRPAPRDISEDLVVNKDLTYGLYHNTYPGLKLAGALAKTPILVPLWFMGVPTPVSDDEITNEAIKELTEQFYTRMKQIHLQCHRDGTIWIFPKYNSKTQSLIWEFIPDETVVDIIKDIDTGEIISIITSEQIKIAVGENKRVYMTRKRIFTEKKITIKWSGDIAQLPNQLRDRNTRNPAGILPIPFANNADGDEKRGRSDYSSIISDLKNYHDIDYKQSQVLARFEPKLGIWTTDVDKWLENNAVTISDSFADMDTYNRDLFLFTGEEKAEYIFPDNAYQAYESGLARVYKKIVEGSLVPEMLWGIRMQGNHASAEEQMNNVVQFVEDKREQKNDAYRLLYTASIKLLNMATMTGGEPVIDRIEWNKLDALSDKVKSEILKDFAQAMSFLVSKAAATKEMFHKLWNEYFPGIAPPDLEDYIHGMDEMATHNQYVDAPFSEVAGMNGAYDSEDDEINAALEAVRAVQNKATEQPINLNVSNTPAAPAKTDIIVNTPDIKIPEIKIPPANINIVNESKSKKKG